MDCTELSCCACDVVIVVSASMLVCALPSLTPCDAVRVCRLATFASVASSYGALQSRGAQLEVRDLRFGHVNFGLLRRRKTFECGSSPAERGDLGCHQAVGLAAS